MANQDRLIKTLIDLIRIDSPSGEEDAIDREISARLQVLGLEVQHDYFNNVIAKLAGSGEPILLSAHLDTVEPGRGIRPHLDGDVLRSDGSTILGGDCKAGISIILEALTAVIESGATHLPVEVVFYPSRRRGLGWRPPPGLQLAVCPKRCGAGRRGAGQPCFLYPRLPKMW